MTGVAVTVVGEAAVEPAAGIVPGDRARWPQHQSDDHGAEPAHRDAYFEEPRVQPHLDAGTTVIL